MRLQNKRPVLGLKSWPLLLAMGIAGVGPAMPALAQQADHPAILPTPRHLVWQAGHFALQQDDTIQSADAQAVGDFLTRLKDRTGTAHSLANTGRIRFNLLGNPDAQIGDQGYRLAVTSDSVDISANKPVGLFYGSETLIQLVSADGRSIPCVAIDDWPSMGYRGTMVDISRGLVPNVSTFKHIILSLARLKMNAIQPYIEDTFAFKAFPFIGRDRGAWSPEDARQLSDFAKQYYVDLSPCFESLGHMGQILRHPEMADLRETGDVISPAKEGTYKFLSTCYHELAQAFPFPYLNVGCDETGGLGAGPSKAMAEKEGVGKVYAYHLNRLDQLCKEVHFKMQFWGDMMLNYPGIVADMPKDALVLNWNYGSHSNFTSIGAYKAQGYQQIVCPGIESWSQMFPNVDAAEPNIRGFVKEGKAAGVLGMLDTAWRDNGEVLFDYDWYADAIGAECSWASTPAEGAPFDRAFENAFFGPGSNGLADVFRLFSQGDDIPGLGDTRALYYADPFASLLPIATARGKSGLQCLTDLAHQINVILDAAHPAEQSEVLPYLRLGAARLGSIPLKYEEAWQAAQDYDRACAGTPGSAAAASADLEQATRLAAGIQVQMEFLRQRYNDLWLAENRKPGLQNVLDRYNGEIKACQDVQAHLKDAAADLAAGKPLPPPAAVGLQLPDVSPSGYRVAGRLSGDATWAQGGVLAIQVTLPGRLPAPMPCQAEVPAADIPAGVPAVARVRILDAAGQPAESEACQVDTVDNDHRLLTFFLPDGATGTVRLALDAAAPETAGDTVAVSPSTELKNGLWIQNGRYRALMGPEGAHLYRFDVTAAKGIDMTMPGDTGWNGFNDVGAERDSQFKLKPVLKGPLCVQVECTAPDGFAENLDFYAGVGWFETRFDDPVGFFWNYDDPSIMGSSSATPGQYQFGGGRGGPLPKEGDMSEQQVTHWVAKYQPDGLLLGLVSPGQAVSLRAGPGGGMGGVGVEGGGSTRRLDTMVDVAGQQWHDVEGLYQGLTVMAKASVAVKRN